MLVTILEN
jgi:hypothetical protein